MKNSKNWTLFSITLFLFLLLGVGPILLIAIFFAMPLPLLQFKMSISFLLILSTISTLCLAGLVTRLLKHPINKLLEGQKQIRHGNIQFRLPMEGNQELQSLFKGFNQMAEGVEQAAQKEQLLVEQRALVKLTSQVVHDLRSPLSSLKTASDCFSRMKIPDTDSQKIVHLMQMSTKRLEEIAEELLAKNRDASAALLTFLHDAIDELVSELNSQKKFPNLNIERQYDPSLVQIKVEKRDLQRAVNNVLINAAEAMQGNGKILIKTSQQKESVSLHIQDTGPGMAPEILVKVLRGGFTYNKVNGNGIGMTVVLEVIEKYKGKLEASSIVGLGTTFVMNFPA